jgi:hypothetical protein
VSPAPAERPAFYAAGEGRLRELTTLLHPPYTAWHLSYYAIGAAAARRFHPDRLWWGLAAFALAVGIGAHALDERRGRPLGTHLSDGTLLALGIAGTLGAVAIGVAGTIVVTPWLAPFVIAGALFVPAYNLELFGGRLHSDTWFALGWGAFPALTGYFVQAESLTATGVLIAAGCAVASSAQRRLSTPARQLRRRTRAVLGKRISSDGDVEELTRSGLLAPLDGALSALSIAFVLLASGLVVARL